MFGVVIFGKAKAEVSIVPFQSGSLTYTGTVQHPVWNGFDSSALEISGDTSGTDAGAYSAIFTLKEGHVWSDGSTEPKTVRWTIGRAAVAIPAQSGSPVYTGSEITASFSGYDSAKMTRGGTVKGTNAGTYNATFTPGANFCWPDGTTTARTVTWSIGKAAGSLTLSKSTLAITAKTAQTITATRSGDGAISATSSNTSAATVSVSDTTVTVTAVGEGTATITVKVAAGTNHNAPGNKTCSVTVTLPHIYGVSWDGTSATKWTRTDDAAGFTDPVAYLAGASSYGSPFDNRQPWAGMVKSERTGGTMVAIPKFWYKLTQSGKGIKIQIADSAVAGYAVSPAHMDRGDGKGERDVVYVGRYRCGTSQTSVTGKTYAENGLPEARTAVHNLGADIWLYDFAMHFTICLLYLVEHADWAVFKTIGRGGYSNTSGYTDSMPYHTGTTQSSRMEELAGCQYRNIEGLWHYDEWCDGCYNDANGFNIALNPNEYSGMNTGKCVGIPCNSYPTELTVSYGADFPMFYASKSGGSDSTYSCGIWAYSASEPEIRTGGYHGQRGYLGLFFFDDGIGAKYVKYRLQELP